MNTTDTPNASITVIKRYGNRKLYNTELSRYITLREFMLLYREVPDGLIVVSNATGQDITAETIVSGVKETANDDLGYAAKIVELVKEGKL